MENRFIKLLSMFLVVVLLINMLPMSIFAEEFREQLTMQDSVSLEKIEAEDTYVVSELTDKRTQYTKEFLLSNGLHMATVYADPVHYEKDGQWAEIDNTLKTTRNGTVTNTAGIWNVSFPQQLNGGSVTIEKDGYTLSFAMDGELRSSGELMTAAMGTETAEQLAVGQLQTATAAVQQPDLAAIRDGYEYEEAAPEKLYSQLRYDGVYQNTDVLYDLQANTVKESIVMAAYSNTLRGYRYTLNVGQLLPVLSDDGEITFFAPDKETVVMVMPAPYLLDANNEFSDDIQVQLTGSGDTYTLTYLLPQAWLAAQDRAWPVILDPVVNASRQKANIQDRTVCSKTDALSYTKTVLNAGYSTKDGIMRSYVKFNDLPFLTSSDVVVEAIFKLHKVEDSSVSKTVEAHKVTEDWNETTIEWDTQPSFDSEITDFRHVKNDGWYLWQVTDIVRSWYTDENHGLMIKMSNDVENGSSSLFRQFYSSNTGSAHRPILQVYFLNNNGLESYWSYTNTSAGRAGVGYVNNFTGNMTWIRSDLSFSGSQAPVSIEHIYNANDAIVPPDKQYTEGDPDDTTPEIESNNSNDSGGNYFGLGIGWRTNYHQRVFRWACSDASNASNYYVWEDGDGTDHYFEKVSDVKYQDEDNLDLTLHIDDDGYRIVDKQENTLYFDSLGRLTGSENNQATKTSIEITYRSATSVQIDTIQDGVGRIYQFIYNNNDLLTSIRCEIRADEEEGNEAPDENTEPTVVGSISFGYTDTKLTTVTDMDGETCYYSYNADGLLLSAKDIDGFTVQYEYTREPTQQPDTQDAAGSRPAWEQPYLVSCIQTTDDGEDGGSLSFLYGYNQTTLTDHNSNKQILHFNDRGNVVGIMDDEGHAQYADYTANGHSDTGKANQLTFSSRLQNTVVNLLSDSSFENGTQWTYADGSAVSTVTAQHHYGAKSMHVSGEASGTSFTVAEKESYTFSAYIKTQDDPGTLRLVAGEEVLDTVDIPANTDWTRYEVSYTNPGTTAVQAVPNLVVQGSVGIWVDCAQLENMPTASRYNLVENGDFRYDGVWVENSSCTDNDDYAASTEVSPAAPQLDSTYYKISGNRTKTKVVSQTIPVSGEEGDSFVLAGWAKGYAARLGKLDGYTRSFAVRARFKYTDNKESDDFLASFTPYTWQWQYASAAMVAKKDYKSITVEIVYKNNVNVVYFDGIQLYKEEFGSSYTYADEEDGGEVISVVDAQKKRTEYKYDKNGNLTQILEDNNEKITYTYDDNHNVKTAVTEEGLTYSFEYDKYGNNTKVSISSKDPVSGEDTTISSTAKYTDDGNFQISSTDALGKTTKYGYSVDTGVLEWVQYPEDSESTRTEYTYDAMYRQAEAVCTTDTGTALSVNYEYTDDYLTTIRTPTTTYNFEYGVFGLRKSVKVGNQELAGYTYNQDWYLDKLTYGNNDFVQYEYDKKGRLESQTYEDGDKVSYTYNNDGDLATATDHATGITTTYYYDLLGRQVKYVEKGNGYTHSVGYEYNKDNNLEELVEDINGTKRTTSYEYDDDNRVTSATTDDTPDDDTDGITVTYTYDDFGRVTQQVTKNGETTILTEEFTYNARTGTDENGTAVTLASSQVATYKTTAGNYSVTYTYDYDDNGNITSIYDGTNTVAYQYDSSNQLIQEHHVESEYGYMFGYDEAGNITYRHHCLANESTNQLEVVGETFYSYDNSSWGDLLTGHFEGEIVYTYDPIGNPLSLAGRTYTWEHGRQLATLTQYGTTWEYQYNTDGLRTQRSDGNATYQYVYNGSQLTQMAVDTDGDDEVDITLAFTYDASGVPLTVTYGSTTYYYATNLQGDVVAILNANGTTAASYTYDAWGKCLNSYTSGIGFLNPLRYRGYVYDQETKLYYLQSRYYDPEVGRFINADGLVATGQGFTGNNMFAYCGNNPIANYDPSGNYYACAEDRLTDGSTTGGGRLPPKPSYISDQTADDIGNLKLGDETVAKKGCAVVATYNAFIDLEHYNPFQCVLDFYNGNNGSHIAESGGIYNSSVVLYFELKGYSVVAIHDDYSKIDEMSQYADACLLSYRWDPDPQKAGHIVSYHKLAYNYMFINVSGPVVELHSSPSVFLESQGAVSATGIFIFKE